MSGQLAPATRDVRNARHHPCEVQTTCRPSSAWRKDPWPALIRDVSTAGVTLRLERRFERGAGLAIDLPTEGGGKTTVLARVSHVEAGEGGWLLGCTFVSELSRDQVRVVLSLDPLYDASAEDTCVLPRQPAPSVSGVLFRAPAAGQTWRWYVKRLDLSANWPPPAGKVVSFRLPAAGAGILTADLIIKRCRLVGSHWVVDCAFRDEPAVEVLHALTAPAGV